MPAVAFILKRCWQNGCLIWWPWEDPHSDFKSNFIISSLQQKIMCTALTINKPMQDYVWAFLNKTRSWALHTTEPICHVEIQLVGNEKKRLNYNQPICLRRLCEDCHWNRNPDTILNRVKAEELKSSLKALMKFLSYLAVENFSHYIQNIFKVTVYFQLCARVSKEAHLKSPTAWGR